MAEMPLEPGALLEHRAFLRAIAKGLLRDEDAAEDVAQDALLAAMERPPRGPDPRGWLAAVARNLARMARRGERRRAERERRAARPEATAPADEATALLEVQRKVVEAVVALEEPYRTAVVLHYFHDLSVRELAARLRVPKQTARTRLRRGLGILRARLDRDYGGNRSWAPLLVVLAADPKTVSVAGAALMTAKTKIAIAGVICILLTLVTVKWGGLGGTETPRAEPARPAVAELSLEVPLPALPEPVDLNLVDRDRDLHGIVVDRSGTPIAGAALRAIFYPHRRTFTFDPCHDLGAEGASITRSARDGTFRLPLERGQEVGLRASASGHAPLEIAHLQAGERVRVELSEAASLTVRVNAATGAPVAGAAVELRCAEVFEIRRTASTGATGVVRFDGLPSGVTLLVGASHPAHGKPDWTRDVRAGGEVEVVLPAGRRLGGRVTDAATGAPVAGARVGMEWSLDPCARTDADGRYELNGWRGEMWAQTIEARADGYLPAAAALVAATQYDFALSRGMDVTGRIVGPSGEAVAGALVAAIGAFETFHQSSQPMSRAHAVSSDTGAFRLGPLRHKTDAKGSSSAVHTLVVTAPGYGRHLLDFDASYGTSLGDIVIPAARRIAGMVVDAAGDAVPRTRVTVDGENEDRYRLGRFGRGGQQRDYGRLEERYTDDLGRFCFPDLAPGRYRVEAELRGLSAAVSENVVVEAGDVEVTLHLPATRPFVVVVVDDSGAPVYASVTVDHEAGSSTARTDGSGRATLRVSGRVHRVHPPFAMPGGPAYGDAEPIPDVPDGIDEIRVVLSRWDEIRGTVIDEAGDAVAQAIVEVRWAAEVKRISANAHGRFHVSVPPGARADVRVVGKYASVPSFPGAITEDRGLSGELKGVAAGTLDAVVRTVATRYEQSFVVRVLSPDGAPLAGARVGYQPCPPGAESAETGRDGRARIEKAPPAEVTVWVWIDERTLGYVKPRVPSIVPAGQEIELRCRRAVQLVGTVVDADGKPVAKAKVSAVEGTAVFTGRCDERGRFDILVPQGVASVMLQAYLDDPDRVRLRGAIDHCLADGEARIVIKPE